MSPSLKSLSLSIAAALLAAAPAAQAAYSVVAAPVAWGASDAALGLDARAQIEDFEDTTLIAGLKVQVSESSNGAYGPTATLPRTFNPYSDDWAGSAFHAGNWDGSRVLLNTGDNGTANYFSTSAWGDVTFTFAGGATQVGFSLQQMQHNAWVTINGSTSFWISSITGGFNFSGGRNSYVRIDVGGNSAPITSLRIDGSIYDAWTIDHLAVTQAVPEPQAYALMAAGLAFVGMAVRRRRATA